MTGEKKGKEKGQKEDQAERAPAEAGQGPSSGKGRVPS